MKADKKHQKSGIYCIKNTVNNKVYIGKSKNIYKRIHQHLYDLKNKRKENENSYFMNSWYKYGNENFEYFILEYLDLNEDLLKERELYWMDIFNSTNRSFGYNLRRDSSTNMIVHPETSEKISERLKKEWSEGIRRDHGEKLSKNWNKNPERKIIQSKIMSKNLTKYYYNLFDLENNFIEKCNYSRLKELKLQNVFADFHKKKLNKVKFKGFLIEKVKIEDIVRHSEKSEINSK